MNAAMNALRKPTSDFARVRDGRESIPLYIDVDLSVARSGSSALQLSIAGNSFYIDANPNDGVAQIQFQDTGFDNASPPIYCGPGAIFRVPFTQISVENAAQAGKKIRIIYGVDIDFIAGSIASVQAQVSPAGFTPTQATFAVNTTSGTLLSASGVRKYLLIQNKGATPIYLNFSGAAATVADGIEVGAGGTAEFVGAQPTALITAISTALNSAIVIVQG